MKLKGKTNNKNMKPKGNFQKKKGQVKMAENPGKKKKKNMADMTVDDMFSMIQDDDSDDGELTPPSTENIKKIKKATKNKKKKKGAQGIKDEKEKEDYDNMPEDDDDSFEEDEEMANASSMSRKEYLEKLKETDPEFYATMLQSTDIMDLKSSDEDESSDEEEDEDDTDTQPPPEQEDGSEESDTEISDMQGRGGNITAAMIAEWEQELRGPSPLSAFLDVQQAFLAAIESLSGGKKDMEETSSKYTVKGSQSFNAVIRLCLRNMAPALRTIFQLKDANHLPYKSKKWSKYKNSIKLYLRQLIALTEAVAEPTVAEAILSRGVLPVIPFYACYQNMSKLLARRLVSLWATSDKKVRVLAFMALFRLTQSIKGEFLEWMLKKMYLAYVQNCRFTSPSTWGLIDFMRVCLVELYSLDHARAYKHAFIYIRQMAIHLRNAILVPKKDRVQLVYNWQYIHCLNLWCDLLGKTHPNPALQPMIFPVTQVAIGTLKLQPTPTFFPLAFHICRMLTELSRNTGTFIPVLPFLLEILNKAIFFKQPKKSSIRPFDWLCMLRLSRGELGESAFKDGVVDQVYDGMVSYLSAESHSIGFPDLVVPAVWQLKNFLKKCRSPNYCRKFKQLLDKIRENTAFIEDRRKDVKFGIADTKAIKDWEISVKQAGTPLNKYYVSWRKVRDKEHQQRIANSVSVRDYNITAVKKRQLERRKGKGKSEMDDMFESDEEEDLDTNTRLEIEDDDAEEALNKEEEEDGDDAEEEGEDGDDDDEEEDDDSGDEADDDTGPPKKKVKKEKSAQEIFDDIKIPDHNVADVVKEFNFSDLEDEDGPDDDDYGVASDSES